MPRPGRPGQAGSITPIVAFVCMILGVLGIGATALGRLVVAKQDAQQVADAAALASIDAVREAGKATDPHGAMVMGQRNARIPVDVSRTLHEVPGEGEGVGHMISTAVATAEIDAPRFIFPEGRLAVRARARADIEQERKSDVNRLTPRVVLVLDYSSSMTGAPIETQEEAVRKHLLERDDGLLDMDFSAVLFGTTIVDSVGFEPDAVQTILDFFDKYTANGSTGTDLALAKAAEILGEPGERPSFVIVASDGGPDNLGAARDAGDLLWKKTEATVMTLHIGGGAGAAEFMKYISGTNQERHNEAYYYPVTDLSSFEEALDAIIAAIACKVSPLDPDALKDPSTVRVYLEPPPGGGPEIRLEPVEDLHANRERLGFKFEPQTRELQFTNAACSKMKDENHRALVRYNRSQLIE